ncbi:DNA repair protein RecO [Acetivibrio mesophilus]|uniref:DNA repair protein RecO n=1 Tax=Acetivibrio mesophilus TaxID=2487273 RepID=A0A4Q0I6C3_9FIRM|nr:DNA repair protein RecO [Acetivibrio mesophilus]ODM25095.1 DNA repair protein RecO [Clostridium sp. Bc-iso-3]RXE59901.1 DNA repair protein RecO [Acetivibrio mesophilus]HHV29676.1 DNA repair protein RecO [Clostridium sp.]
MSYLKTTGIVIKEVNTGEADRIVTIFSKNKGKISASAKGARRPKSHLVAGTQLLCYSEFVLFKGKDMYSVTSCDVIEPFYDIRSDLERLTYAAHMMEMVNDVIFENQPATRLLQLFLNSLYMLTKTDKSPLQIVRIFEFRLLSIIGYAPWVSGCTECGSTLFDSMYFSFLKCGFLCGGCLAKDKGAIRISEGAAKALNYIVYSKMNNLFSFEVSENVLDELGRVSRRYMRDRLEKNYNKLDFIKNINGVKC